MDKYMLKNIAEKLNVYDESVIRKAEEMLRLLQSKSTMKTLNNQTQSVLCLDLASHFLGMGFDKGAALSLSGLKKPAYQNSLNTIEQILGLNRVLMVSDACVQLGCTAIKDDADALLSTYKKQKSSVEDWTHPQYAAAAVYLACKAKKISIDKQKVVLMSRIKASQWKELLGSFKSLEIKTGKQLVKDSGAESLKELEDEEDLKSSEQVEEEEYEIWKQRILKEAYEAVQKTVQMVTD